MEGQGGGFPPCLLSVELHMAYAIDLEHSIVFGIEQVY